VERDVPARCDSSRGHPVPITVNPGRPAELVTDSGVTEDSIRFLDAWIMLFRGSVLLVAGGGGAFPARVCYRQGQTERRCC
jgi:hypothetical protein